MNKYEEILKTWLSKDGNSVTFHLDPITEHYSVAVIKDNKLTALYSDYSPEGMFNKHLDNIHFDINDRPEYWNSHPDLLKIVDRGLVDCARNSALDIIKLNEIDGYIDYVYDKDPFEATFLSENRDGILRDCEFSDHVWDEVWEDVSDAVSCFLSRSNYDEYTKFNLKEETISIVAERVLNVVDSYITAENINEDAYADKKTEIVENIIQGYLKDEVFGSPNVYEPSEIIYDYIPKTDEEIISDLNDYDFKSLIDEELSNYPELVSEISQEER